MTAGEGDALVVERRIAAPPDVVFAYFTEPDRYRRWQGTEAELDPRPGGVFHVTMGGTSRTVARGAFVEVEPYRRLVFTWGWEQADWLPDGMRLPPGSTTVEVTFVPDGDGTLLRLRHSGIGSAAAREFHSWGWDLTVGRLATVAEGLDPGPDPFVNL